MEQSRSPFLRAGLTACAPAPAAQGGSAGEPRAQQEDNSPCDVTVPSLSASRRAPWPGERSHSHEDKSMVSTCPSSATPPLARSRSPGASPGLATSLALKFLAILQSQFGQRNPPLSQEDGIQQAHCKQEARELFRTASLCLCEQA